MAAIKNMMLILPCLILFCGCVEDSQETGISQAELDGWACAIAGLTCSGSDPSGPDNAPKPGDTCPTCQGSGKVGDGRVFSTCLDCDGTGTVPGASEPDPVAVVPVEPEPAVESSESDAEIVAVFEAAFQSEDCDPITGL